MRQDVEDQIYAQTNTEPSPGVYPKGVVGMVKHWRLPLVACLMALLLHIGLFLAMVGAGSPFALVESLVMQTAHAAPLADDDDPGEDSNNDHGDPKNGKWEGTIVTFPEALIGTWTILINGDQVITVTATAATRFKPERASEYFVGTWVEIKADRQPDGTLLAKRIRVDDHEMGDLVVRLESSVYSATIASKYKLTLKSTLLSDANIFLFGTNDDDERNVAKEIAKEPGVIWAEINYVNSMPEDDGYKTWAWGGAEQPDSYVNQSAYQQIHWGQTSRAYQGAGVVVAVLDTGIYTAHEQFVGKLRLPSFDVVSDDTDPSETEPGLAWGHGTHVAGIILAVAPEALILPVRVLDANGRGNTFLLAYAIEWASQQPGVNVINLSLGTVFDSKILSDVIKDVVKQGIVVVAAAGNDNVDTIQYPAGYEGVISVTAVDGDYHKAPFANYGQGWVDIAAPGVGIMSTMINDEGAGYASWSGTSMSTAFVSGAAALVVGKALAPRSFTDEIISQLWNHGGDLDPWNPTYEGQLGRLLNVSAALQVQTVQVMLQFMPFAQR